MHIYAQTLFAGAILRFSIFHKHTNDAFMVPTPPYQPLHTDLSVDRCLQLFLFNKMIESMLVSRSYSDNLLCDCAPVDVLCFLSRRVTSHSISSQRSCVRFPPPLVHQFLITHFSFFLFFSH